MESVHAVLPGTGREGPEPSLHQWLPALLATAGERLQARGLCARSRAIYLTRIRHLATTLRRPPGDLHANDLRDYLRYRAVTEGLSDATLRQVRSALRFLFRDVVRRPDLAASLSRRPVRSLPGATPLSRDEALAMIEAAPSLRDRILIGLLFGSGLRLAEALALRAADLNPAEGTVRAGARRATTERLVVLSVRIEPSLRRYLAGRRPMDPVFPGAGRAPLSPRAAQRALERAARRARLWPRGSARDLRRGFAAELARIGLHRATIQILLGVGAGDPGPGGRSLPPGARSPL
jgi:site-specific recombinase XerD